MGYVIDKGKEDRKPCRAKPWDMGFFSACAFALEMRVEAVMDEPGIRVDERLSGPSSNKMNRAVRENSTHGDGIASCRSLSS